MTKVGGWRGLQYSARVEVQFAKVAYAQRCPSVVPERLSDISAGPPELPRSLRSWRYPATSLGTTEGAQRKNPCPTVFRPFSTVFDRFPDRAKSKIARRIKAPTVFGVPSRR